MCRSSNYLLIAGLYLYLVALRFVKCDNSFVIHNLQPLMMIGIKVKAKCASEKKKSILNICANLCVKILKILSVEEGFNVIVESSVEADKLFSDSASTLFSAESVTLLLPPELRASRSILMFNVDSLIYNNDCEDIKADILHRNDWCQLSEVIKFQRSKGIKIIFHSSSMADLCLSKGLKVFQLYVPGSALKRDDYCPILTCFKCYQLDSHLMINCPKDQNFMVCSNCSSLGHTWKNCISSVKKCINCDGNHSTVSMSCTLRRDLLRRTREARNARRPGAAEHTHRSYANMASNSSSQVFGTYPSAYSNVDPGGALAESIIKAHICVAVASVCGAGDTATFQRNLDKILSDNDLPTVKIGEFALSVVEGSQTSGTIPTSVSLNGSSKFESQSIQSGDDQQATSAASTGPPLEDVAGSSVSRVTRSRRAPLAEHLPSHKEPVVRTSSIRDIKIFKSRGTKYVDASNIRSLAASGKVFIECSGASENKCLEFLSKKNSASNIAFSKITELPTEVFMKRMSSYMSKSNTTAASVVA